MAVVSPLSTEAGAAPRTSQAKPRGSVVRRTFVEAEKLAGIRFDDVERETMVESIEEHLERLRQRQRLGPVPLSQTPATVFDPRLPGRFVEPEDDRFLPSRRRAGPLPTDEADIAFAPLTKLSAWIRQGDITSESLTGIYLDRLRRLGRKLECVVTLTEDLAMRQARQADRELTAGRYRGPLHGIPWGAKDLFDTAGIATTFGATPHQHRVPDSNAVVVQRLEDAGAVLVGKLTLGALAYGDIWFGGRTRNPWDREQGSSGSSAGSAAATAAGLVGFSLGTETYGSIVSPCARCGVVGLRPTFGRVARTGAMPLCWTLDKIGPICRTVEDCMFVLRAINGADPADPASVDVPLPFEAQRAVRRLRVGFNPAWFAGDSPDAEHSRQVLQVLPELGLELVEIELPDWPYDVLLQILLAESAAAFEDLTRGDRDAEMVWQSPEAWPNTFRRAWFIPAVELVQVDRFRRQVMEMMADRFDEVDVIVSPNYAADLLLITNNTGHPSLTLRTGFRESGTPQTMTLWGPLYDEDTLCRVGMAVEKRCDVWDRRPPL
jgi:Asp-tRNA(Asn)/Glu-tRNA(Gln) amidotransferase A subunit family amidase